LYTYGTGARRHEFALFRIRGFSVGLDPLVPASQGREERPDCDSGPLLARVGRRSASPPFWLRSAALSRRAGALGPAAITTHTATRLQGWTAGLDCRAELQGWTAVGQTARLKAQQNCCCWPARGARCDTGGDKRAGVKRTAQEKCLGRPSGGGTKKVPTPIAAQNVDLAHPGVALVGRSKAGDPPGRPPSLWRCRQSCLACGEAPAPSILRPRSAQRSSRKKSWDK